MPNTLTTRLSRKNVVAIIVPAVVLVCAIIFGPSLYRKFSGPPTPQEVRQSIWSYIKKESGQNNFASSNVSVSNELAAAQADPPKKKNNPSGQLFQAASKYFQRKQSETTSYKAIYNLLGQELSFAEGLLESTNVMEQQAGFQLAQETSRFASTPAENPWLAARICEAYLWPKLDLAQSGGKSGLDADAVLRYCESVFSDASETNSLIHNYQLVIANAGKTKRADIARFRLSHLLEQEGRYAEALACLKEMSNTNKNGFQQRTAFLEQKLSSGDH
ncbi:MAG TPA: hypothetical protein VGE41_01615 [Verrucomicrobiae bacterium]|jgi:hypothetical protein